MVTITGWAKGYSYTVGDRITGPTNHAWNAIKINDEWYLIDSTWGAGYIRYGGFVRDFDEFYFLSPPEQFVYNHLPVDSRWQLLDKPLTKEEFAALPSVYSNFFNYGLSLGNNNQAVIQAKNNLQMNFPAPPGVYLLAELTHNGRELPESYTSCFRSAGGYVIQATLPETGTYNLVIYARKGSEYGTYNSVLEYKIIAGNN